NHLDIESREALEDALSVFTGAIILISHDRALLEAVGSRTVVVEDGGLKSYTTGWAEYQRDRDEKEAMKSSSQNRNVAKGKSDNAKRGGSPAKETAKAARRLASLEKKIERAEADLAKLEDKLADPGAWATPEKTDENTRRHDRAKAKVAKLYEEWEAAEDADKMPA
ncbi:MAG: ABC transporter ATP-binding protein, partial [Solirubrobacterales bacterium]